MPIIPSEVKKRILVGALVGGIVAPMVQQIIENWLSQHSHTEAWYPGKLIKEIIKGVLE